MTDPALAQTAQKGAPSDQPQRGTATIPVGRCTCQYTPPEVERWAVRDDLGVLQQLGVILAPGRPGEANPTK